MKVRYYGQFGPSGYGRAAIDMCMALMRAGAVVEIRPLMKKGEAGLALDRLPRDVVAALRRDADLTDPDVVIIHDLPVDAVKRHEHIALDLAAVDKPMVCYTTWEGQTCHMNVLEPLRSTFDAVWVPSRANELAFLLNQADEPYATSDEMIKDGHTLKRWATVSVVPHAFDPEDPWRSRRYELARDDRFRFYYIGAWNSRKNPSGLIKAWASAFGPDDPVELVMQCAGVPAEAFALAVGATGLNPKEMARTTFQNSYLNDQQLADLHRTADCFVTASRGEAWNLPAFDAMLAGRHVIATGGLGSDDFLAGTSWNCVRGRAMPAQVDVTVQHAQGNRFNLQVVGAQGLTSRDTWMEPDLSQLVNSLRGVARSQTRDLLVTTDPVGRYGYEVVGKHALKLLQEIVNR